VDACVRGHAEKFHQLELMLACGESRGMLEGEPRTKLFAMPVQHIAPVLSIILVGDDLVDPLGRGEIMEHILNHGGKC